MSKSWIIMSRNIPPETFTYSIGGGAGSRLVMRRICGSPSLPARIKLPHSPVVSNRIAGESDLQLHAGPLHGLDGLVDRRQVKGDRLLAKDVFSVGRRLDDHSRMGVGARADHHGVDLAVFQQRLVVFGHHRHVEVGRALFGGRPDHVRDCDHRRLGNSKGEMLRMEPPDPSCSDDADLDFLFHAQFSSVSEKRSQMFHCRPQVALEIDAVVICSSTDTHARMIVEAAAHGKQHLLREADRP